MKTLLITLTTICCIGFLINTIISFNTNMVAFWGWVNAFIWCANSLILNINKR